VPKFYSELKGLIDELEMYHPSVTDAATLRRYRQDLVVSKFLFDLSPTLRTQVQGQILGGDNILTLTTTFSTVMRVSTRADIIVVVVILEDEDVDLLEVDVAHMEADRVPLGKDPGNADL